MQRARPMIDLTPEQIAATGVLRSRLPFRFSLKAGRAKTDPEKLVTPGILYASARNDERTAHLVAVGWWDWHISLLFSHRIIAYREEQP